MTLTAAQNQREIDDASDAEIALAERRAEVATDLFNAYFEGAPYAVEQIDEAIADDQGHYDDLMVEIRKGGSHVHVFMRRLVSDVTDKIVSGRNDDQLDVIGRGL